MKARVFVTLKPGVLDPQGKAIHHALEGLGFSGIRDVRAGKLIELDLAEDTSDADIEGKNEVRRCRVETLAGLSGERDHRIASASNRRASGSRFPTTGSRATKGARRPTTDPAGL